MEYEYYISVMYDTFTEKRSLSGMIYTLNYRLDSKENIIDFIEHLKRDGYKDPVILFFKQLNE